MNDEMKAKIAEIMESAARIESDQPLSKSLIDALENGSFIVGGDVYIGCYIELDALVKVDRKERRST